MCRFFSALALRNGDIRYDHATDSHSMLIDAFGLSAVENAYCNHFAKVEYVCDGQRLDEVDSYRLVLDQETAPIWWDDVRDRVEAQCRSVVKSMIVTDERKCLLGGRYILAGYAKVGRTRGATILAMYDDARVAQMSHCHIQKMADRSQIGEATHSTLLYVTDDAQIGLLTGKSAIEYAWDRARIQTVGGLVRILKLGGDAAIECLVGNALVELMTSRARIALLEHDAGVRWAEAGAQVGVVRDCGWIGELRRGAKVRVLRDRARIYHALPGSVIELPLSPTSRAAIFRDDRVSEPTPGSVGALSALDK